MSTTNKHKQNNKGRLYRKIRNVLIITLIAITGFLAYKLLAPNPKQATYSFKQETIQQKTVNDVAKWQNTINQLKAEFNKDASLNVLQGLANVDITYTDESILSKNDKLNFLQKKWTEWQSKSLNVSSQYKFGFAYDLSNIEIVDFGSGNIKIKLSQNKLDLKYVEEQTEKTVLTDKVGVLAKKFTVAEVSAISDRTRVHTSNTIRNKKEIRDKATQYLQEIVTDISKEFGFKDVQIDIQPDYLLDNTEVNILNITYNQ
jgi:LPS O-antigen subunit length determinant protein (WzzB/FepE family)